MTGEPTAIGLDVGGTHVRAARVDGAGTVLDHLAEPVEAGREAFASQVERLIGALIDNRTIGVGFGIPGRVEASEGRILSAGYLDIAGLDLPGLVGNRFDLPAWIENDAAMALIAEAAARPDRAGPTLMITIGTGIGGAILQDGLPWRGGGTAGQFGHLVVAEGGPRCKCGRRGCVESFSSGTALKRLLTEAGLPERADDLLFRAAAGDRIAARVLEDWTRPFLRALQTLSAAFDPQLIVLGGGLGATMDAALKRLKHEREGEWFALPVEPAILLDRAGVIGAGLRCFVEGAR